jgi:hypothetical protein
MRWGAIIFDYFQESLAFGLGMCYIGSEIIGTHVAIMRYEKRGTMLFVMKRRCISS